MHEAGCSGLVHWDDPGGWDGEGGKRGVLAGEYMCINMVFSFLAYFILYNRLEFHSPP